MKFVSRIPWYLVGGFVLGIALGLVYAWLISPVQYVDGTPDAMGADFKDQYRLLIASTYQADGNLAGAQVRLATLGDINPFSALTGQASRLLEAGDPQGAAYTLLLLAQAFEPVVASVATGTTTSTPTGILFIPTLLPSDTPFVTDTPGGPSTNTPSMMDVLATSTTNLFLSPTPLPTHTPEPTPGAPYALIAQETICDANQLGMLIQVQVRNAAGEPVPGTQIIITWAGGREYIFTGLKHELGDGYADFTMTPGIRYGVQIASGGIPVKDLEAPSCESSGATWLGSVLLIFQQP